MSSKLFTDFGLSAELMKAIARLGFEQPAPIQAEALPLLLEGKDVVGQSQTGSGKTAAFAIPAVERLQPAERYVQVLILCPTRELAVQVSEEVHKLAYFKPGVKPLPIYGGQSYDRQFAGLRAGANIVIGTPGRVMDHMNRGTLKLDRIRTVILDEADEMLNMGFRDDIEFILKTMPPERQTVLFSATVPRAIEDLIARYTRNPVRVKIEGVAMTVPTVEQVYVEVDRRWKMEALERLIDLHDINRSIVFCNTQRMVDELTEHMNAAGYGADCIHGGMAQAARDRVMKKFRTGGVGFLVATDVAARGIDVDDIQVVFNYDLPYDGEDYVHRIGRTGRAGRSGLAISFVSGREVFQIRQIERYTRQRMRRVQVPTHNEIEAARMNQLVQRVRETLKAGDFRHYDHVIEGLLEEGLDSMDLINALLHHLNRATGPAANETAKPAVGDPRAARGSKATFEAHSDRAAQPATVRPSTPAPTSASTAAADATPGSTGEHAARPTTPPPTRPPASSYTVAKRPRPTEDRPAPRPAADHFRAKPDRRPPEGPGGYRPAPKNYQEAPRKPFPASRDRERDARDPKKRFAAPAERGFEARRPSSPDFDRKRRGDSFDAPKRPVSRRTPEQMTRVWLSVGQENGISPGDIKGCILGETGIATEAVGFIDLREKHSFVDVASDQVTAVIPKLNRAHLGGRKLKAKVA
jgi:ATP-dependent RNA helicase DeaD